MGGKEGGMKVGRHGCRGGGGSTWAVYIEFEPGPILSSEISICFLLLFFVYIYLFNQNIGRLD